MHYSAFVVEIEVRAQYIFPGSCGMVSQGPRQAASDEIHGGSLMVAEVIRILVGTMTGTAELVAEEMQEVIESDSDHDVTVTAMDALNASVFEQDGIFLICTSTYGQGDVPDNAMNLYNDLAKKRPDMSAIRYGVFGLGDSTYDDTYNFGGQRFDDLLTELGATRIGERDRHDASGANIPEDQGADWIRAWLPLLG
jgi:MioC protein